MKIKIDTYNDFLNINFFTFNKIVDEDFDSYTDQEIKNIGIFMTKFNNEFFKLTQYLDINMLLNENIELSKEQFLSMTYKEILAFFNNGAK